MTAGSGLVHAEVSSDAFKDRGGPLEILQLWVNLPPRLKMSAPRYVGLQAAEIPAIRLAEGGVIVHLVSGSFDGHDGAMKSLTGVFMSVVEMHAGTRVAFPDLEGRNVFLYVVEGSIRIGGVEARGHTLAELSSDGDSVEIDAAADATLLFGHADPIGAPVASYGPLRDEHARGDPGGRARLPGREVRQPLAFLLRGGDFVRQLLARLVVRHAQDEALGSLPEGVGAVHLLAPVFVGERHVLGTSSMKASCEPWPPKM
jgi:hypothetical protein